MKRLVLAACISAAASATSVWWFTSATPTTGNDRSTPAFTQPASAQSTFSKATSAQATQSKQAVSKSPDNAAVEAGSSAARSPRGDGEVRGPGGDGAARGPRGDGEARGPRGDGERPEGGRRGKPDASPETTSESHSDNPEAPRRKRDQQQGASE